MGRPFTIKDSAMIHPMEFTKGVAPLEDQQRIKQKQLEDLHMTITKSLVSASLRSLELIYRSQTLHHNVDHDEAVIQGLKGKVADFEESKKNMKQLIEAAKSREVLTKQRAEASEKKCADADQLLVSKDAELLEKVRELADAKAELSLGRSEQEEVTKELAKVKQERSLLLRGKMPDFKSKSKEKPRPFSKQVPAEDPRNQSCPRLGRSIQRLYSANDRC